MRPSWTASYELAAVVRALESAVGVPRSVQVHCSGIDLTEVCRCAPRPYPITGCCCLMLHLGRAAPGSRRLQTSDLVCPRTVPAKAARLLLGRTGM